MPGDGQPADRVPGNARPEDAPPTATACSAISAELAEPLAGTAAAARTWLCVEQPGPYGAEALVESHFDHAVGAELAGRAKSSGVRVQLVRRPGRHADEHLPITRRRVFLAHTAPGATWLLRGTVDDPAELLDLDLQAAGAGIPPSFGQRDDSPLLLVCTNGRRDVCCALYGRPVAGELAARHGETVWETTHTGGHRFAPTGVLLPTGYLYGRLDVPFAERLLAAAGTGTVLTERCRGRSTWSPAGQVAELAVRELTGTAGPDLLQVEPDAADEPDADDPPPDHANGNGGDPAGWRVRVTSLSGAAWSVRGREETLVPDRKTSCAKAPVTATAHVATGVDELAPATQPS